MGIKSKYTEDPEFYNIIAEGLARDGKTDVEIAESLKITERTLNDWKKRYSGFKTALKTGKEVVDRGVENSLLKRANGYEYEEVKTYVSEVDGKTTKRIEKVTKHVSPDVTAQIFWLKNRQPEKWRDGKNLEVTGKDGKAIQTTNVNVDYNGLTEEQLKDERTQELLTDLFYRSKEVD